MRRAAISWLLVLAACGRIGFADLGDSGSSSSDGSGMGNGSTMFDATAVRSCTSLPSICGPGQQSNCCESPVVPGGSFARSYDVASDGMYANASYPAAVSDFRLDKYEVTVGRFRQFVAAGFGTVVSPPVGNAGAHASIPNSGWNAADNANLVASQAALIASLNCDPVYQSWTDTPGGNENRPINCVTWYEAMAFCAWDGGYLPTEAEWNYAAAGGNEQRAYPWSKPPGFLGIDPAHATYYDGTNCVGDPAPGCSVADLGRVGARPQGDGKWLQSDLGGNVWEWVLDSYAGAYPQSPCVDCANLMPSSSRMIRGGSFTALTNDLRASQRSYSSPTFRHLIGFRCARAL